MAIPYSKQTWTDGSGGGTPVSAARLGVLEQGIMDVSNAPAVRVFHNAAQATTTAVAFVLAFNSERFDQAAGSSAAHHDTVTNNSRLTCLYAGVYQIVGNAEFANNATTGIRQIAIRLNGTTTIAEISVQQSATVATVVPVATVYALAVNDYVELLALQTSGGNLNVNATGNYSPEFAMVRIG